MQNFDSNLWSYGKTGKKRGEGIALQHYWKKMLKGDVVWLTTHVQTCLAPNQVVASCVNTDLWLDKITQKSRHARVLRHLLQNMYRYRWFDSWVIKRSSSRPGCNRFTCGKWFIGYNLGTDYGAKSQFGSRWITFLFFSYWDLKVSGKFYFSLQPMCVEEGRVRVDVIQSARSIANQNKWLQHDF